jgi:hypothetical protein
MNLCIIFYGDWFTPWCIFVFSLFFCKKKTNSDNNNIKKKTGRDDNIKVKLCRVFAKEGRQYNAWNVTFEYICRCSVFVFYFLWRKYRPIVFSHFRLLHFRFFIMLRWLVFASIHFCIGHRVHMNKNKSACETW